MKTSLSKTRKTFEKVCQHMENMENVGQTMEQVGKGWSKNEKSLKK